MRLFIILITAFALLPFTALQAQEFEFDRYGNPVGRSIPPPAHMKKQQAKKPVAKKQQAKKKPVKKPHKRKRRN